jgi:hypothetical protein
MGGVYKGAILTISASRSKGPESGILTRQDWYLGVPAVLFNLKMETSEDSRSRASVSDQRRFHPEGLIDLLKNGPLSRRGWTLQEFSARGFSIMIII